MLIAALLDVHIASQQECEFILCEAVQRSPQITTIKNGSVQSNLPSAWIGSRDAFEAYQAAFHGCETDDIRYRMRSAFEVVLNDSAIAEIGHFHVEAYLDHHIRDQDSVFLYELKFEGDTGSEQFHIKANTWTALSFGQPAFGAYAISYFRSMSPIKHAVAVHFHHGYFGILLCPQVDCEKTIILRSCTSIEFLSKIWDEYGIPMEGFAITLDNRIQLVQNFG